MPETNRRPEVLFVCVHNAGRSQMAAALLGHYAGDRVVVRSAGTAPADAINPVVVEALAEMGIDVGATGARPKKLTEAAVEASDVVITMGCGDQCPFYPGKRYLDWALDDPAGLGIQAVRAIRDEIDRRVRGLVDELLIDDPPASLRAPGRGELLVAVRAAGLNRADYLRYQTSGPAVPGSELAGEVLAVGEAVSGWSVGDRVMARGPGFSAEPVTIDARFAIAVPDSFSWEEAGALPVALMTMHDALVTHGRMQAGDRVLVHAATSGVGVAAVQLAALFGASTVFATSRSQTKLDALFDYLGPLACELVGIDTTATAFESTATDIDVIVDNVGASVLAGNLVAARLTGRIVQVGRLGGRSAEIDLDELARKRIELIGVTFRTRTDDEVAEIVRRAMDDVGDRLDAVRPRIERAYPLAQIGEALEDLARNRRIGKLVVKP